MALMDLYEVVTKLVGPVAPLGESHLDETRMENLRELTALTEKLLADIARVAENHDRPEYSVKRAGTHARDFLTGLGLSSPRVAFVAQKP